MARLSLWRIVCLSAAAWLGHAAAPAHTQTPASGAAFAVGVRQVEYVEPTDHRTLWMAVFYPAIADPAGKLLNIPFTVGLTLHADAPMIADRQRHPLVMFSHGRGSDAWQYAWFAQALAAHGYIVAAVNHYHANSYHRELAYLANRIWQRPVDVGLDITWLLHDPFWSQRIDPGRIAVAGHSQGGFTALWTGGAQVDARKFLAFQRRFIENTLIPEHIRRTLPLDAAPALHVHDTRVKAVMAMAPGIVQAFGMDAEGLSKLAVPAFITVGAGDTQTPPGPNAEFAAKHIPHAQLWVIPGAVDHEIFTNECDAEGQDEFPEACIDRPGVDRHALHQEIAARALAFLNTSLPARK